MEKQQGSGIRDGLLMVGQVSTMLIPGSIALVHSIMGLFKITMLSLSSQKGILFRSDTDTETLAHLIDLAYHSSERITLVQAVRLALDIERAMQSLGQEECCPWRREEIASIYYELPPI